MIDEDLKSKKSKSDEEKEEIKIYRVNKYEDELGWKHKNRLDMINSYKPGRTVSSYLEARIVRFCSKHNINSINIGLFGFIGSGKSTVINRLAWFLDKRLWSENLLSVRQIDVPEFRNISLTNERTIIHLTNAINIIDNRGFTEINGNVVQEVQRQCDGKVSPDSVVNKNWEPNIKNSFIRKIMCQECTNLQWAIHCPVIVYRLDEEREPEILQELIDAIYYSTSVFPIIALTFKMEINPSLKLKIVKNDTPLIDILQNEIINTKVARFHQLHCGRVCLIPIGFSNTEYNSPETIETSALIDMLFNCCCVSDLQLKKIMLYNDTSICC
ncbi:hypothetical protein MXB_2703 [Myxobolus squamalis]|nr:hypothetical protein MXB_2703 [Myxobolus squamalis]